MLSLAPNGTHFFTGVALFGFFLLAMFGLALPESRQLRRFVFALGAASVATLLCGVVARANADLSAGSSKLLAIRLVSFALGSLVIAMSVRAVAGWVEKRAARRAAQSQGSSAARGVRIRPNLFGRVLLVGVATFVLAAGVLGQMPAGAGATWWAMWACVLIGAMGAWGCSVGQASLRSMVLVLCVLACAMAAFGVASGASQPLMGFLGIALMGIGAIAMLPSETGPIVMEPRVTAADAEAASGGTLARSRRIFVALALSIAMTALVPLVARIGLEMRAEQYVFKHAPTAPADAPIFGVVVANETIAIVIPGMSDDGRDLIRAAVVLDRSQFATRDDLSHLEVGMVIPAEPIGQDLDAHTFQLKARVAHGDHFHDYDFRVVNTAKASLRELCMAFDAFGASPMMILGALLACFGGTGLTPGPGGTTLKRLLLISARPVLLCVATVVLGPAVCLGAVIGGIARVSVLDCACETKGDAIASEPGTWLLTWAALAVCVAPVGAGLSFVHLWL